MRLAGNAEPKISPKCHLRTIAQLCRVISSQLSHASTIGKKLLNSNIFSRCFDNIANSGPLMDDMGCRVWSTSANFKRFRVLALLLQQPRSPEGDQTLHDAWPSPRLVHYLYIFSNFLPRTEFCQVQISLCVQVLRSPILATLLHGTPPVGISQILRGGIRNGIMELSQTVLAVFGWAAITLGIDPHSSLFIDEVIGLK